jgi:hypothetical protein
VFFQVTGIVILRREISLDPGKNGSEFSAEDKKKHRKNEKVWEKLPSPVRMRFPPRTGNLPGSRAKPGRRSEPQSPHFMPTGHEIVDLPEKRGGVSRT